MKFKPPIPVLQVLDVEMARSHYLDWLGFALDWEMRSGEGRALPGKFIVF
ncbi:MAG: hypothetical protein NPINA01_03270 [Nitrospinaceae bacterium]|nr:MAG: hypothetical protein NPINA01_03270 [Nitrospinaceae bacterium]